MLRERSVEDTFWITFWILWEIRMRTAEKFALFLAATCAVVAQAADRVSVQPNGEVRQQQQQQNLKPGLMRIMWVSDGCH
jgi:hypothetical protein